MDIAVPANLSNSKSLTDQIDPEVIVDAKRALNDLCKDDDYFFVDLREPEEIERTGLIEGAINIPYQELEEAINDPKSQLHLSLGDGSTPVLYCGFGERSALGAQILISKGHKNVHHIEGGIDAWKKLNGNKLLIDFKIENDDKLTA